MSTRPSLQRDAPRTFETENLRFEAMGEAHADLLIGLLSDPDVVAALGGARDADWVRDMCARRGALWAAKGYGPWVIFDKRDGGFVGRAGFGECHVDGVPQVEVTAAFMPAYWHKGYATEMADPILRIAFETMGARALYGFTSPANRAAQGLLEMIGFSHVKDVVHGDQVQGLYQLTAIRWRRSQRKGAVRLYQG